MKRLTDQNQSLRLAEEKSQRELKRLRTHLIQVEDQHTHEQLQADHRENQLRMQLKVLEERLGSFTAAASDQEQRCVWVGVVMFKRVNGY